MTTHNETGESTPAQTNVVVLPPQHIEPQDVRTRASAFVREHPALTLAGALAVGAVAAALVPKRNRRFVAKQGSMLAEAIATAGSAIAHQALASLDSASTTVRGHAHTIAASAEKAGEAALEKAERARHAAYDRAQALLGRKTAPPSLAQRLSAHAGEIAGLLRR